MIPKKTGIYHLFAAVIYAFDGLKVLTKETAFKHEVIFLIFSLGLFVFLDVQFDNYIIFLMLWFMLIAFEAINTAIEYIVDKISPEISDFAKHAKDLGSLGVFCMMGVHVLFLGMVICKALL
jgi:diacylglycerol kinase (ATP)